MDTELILTVTGVGGSIITAVLTVVRAATEPRAPFILQAIAE